MTMEDVVRRLPDPSRLMQLSRSLALLDAILCPEEEYRYYRFDPNWADGQQLASMDNGSGDEYAIVFADGAAFVRGFDHESDLSPFTRDPVSPHPGILEGLPARFQELAAEPAFQMEGIFIASMACWWDEGGPWRCGTSHDELSDGSDWLLEHLLDASPEAYVEFASDYFDVAVDLAVVSSVFHGEPLTFEHAQLLAPDLTMDRFDDEMRSIGFSR